MLGYFANHNDIFDSSVVWELWAWNIFGNVFGWWSFNAMYPVTAFAVFWDIIILVTWIIDNGLNFEFPAA